MLRVLLVFDEYQELSLTETYLKKVGFDVMGIRNEMGIQERILAFNPEVMIVNGKSPKVSSFSVGRKLKENIRYDGKVILIVPKNIRPEPGELMRIKMDALVEAPAHPEKILQLLAKFASYSPDVLIEKLRKARLNDPELNKNLNIQGGKAPERKPGEFSDPVRAKKYEKFIAETPIDKKQTSFERGELKKRQNEMKKTWDFNVLDEIDSLKRQFASALFKKK
jgi:DNA-binding NarL/FixJ family response regulator